MVVAREFLRMKKTQNTFTQHQIDRPHSKALPGLLADCFDVHLSIFNFTYLKGIVEKPENFGRMEPSAFAKERANF